MPSTKLAAKMMKRVGQLRRLGARGLMHTAYVRTLGPSVYSLTDPARSIAAALYRQKALARALPLRLRRLEERVRQEVRADAPHGTRIEFGSDGARFILTLEAMLDLAAADCAVPRVVAVDWDAKAIITAAIDATPFNEGPAGDRTAALEDALSAIHRAGYVLGEIEESSVAFTARGAPIITGLQHAIPLAGASRDISILLRDADRRQFNDTFGTRLMTAGDLRTRAAPRGTIESPAACPSCDVYAPVVLRDDIRWGKIWNTDVGIGRWNFIMKQHLPIPIGGSVLDLGANNGFNPLQMLRAGAASAVGIEIDSDAIDQGKFLKSAFEWRDNRAYDFRYIHGSQGDLPVYDLPRFDVVTALCSLYYLREKEMLDLARYIRTRTDVLVLQCNTDRLIDRSDQETYRKASVEFAVELLEQAGFRNRQIIAPRGYSRPLVIGRTR